MSTLSIAYGRPTLADRIFSRSIVTDIILIAAGTALTSILAQIAIPLWPVPITGQTFAVLFVGATLGVTRAVLSMVLYLAIGLLGLPVFAPQANGCHITGLAALLGPTGGYLIGFILAAAFVGWLAQREWDRKWLRTLARLRRRNSSGSTCWASYGRRPQVPVRPEYTAEDADRRSLPRS